MRTVFQTMPHRQKLACTTVKLYSQFLFEYFFSIQPNTLVVGHKLCSSDSTTRKNLAGSNQATWGSTWCPQTWIWFFLEKASSQNCPKIKQFVFYMNKTSNFLNYFVHCRCSMLANWWRGFRTTASRTACTFSTVNIICDGPNDALFKTERNFCTHDRISWELL